MERIRRTAAESQEPVLEVMAVSWGKNLAFEQNFLQVFGKQNGIKSQFVPNVRLEAYQQLLKAHSKAPDLLELDVVWPAILADDLVDLRPYVKDESAFIPHLLDNYTIDGRLVALPVYVDMGVLYYRPELLEKYGFRKPPDTWEELEHMAGVIQKGERAGGNKDFWGYIWQGSASEGGTCNALEWQASFGGGNFIEARGGINVRSGEFTAALRRATGWINTISPPAEYVYREDDSVNLWDAGQTAFMRNWVSGYSMLAQRPGKDQRHFAVAPMPAGAGGHRGTLGGAGMAVSKYAAHRDLAIQAVLELASEATDLQRVWMTEGIPTHVAVIKRKDVKARSLLLAVATELMSTMVARPAIAAGDKYDAVSLEYAQAVNSVLRRTASPEDAMAKLEKRLVELTGLAVNQTGGLADVRALDLMPHQKLRNATDGSTREARRLGSNAAAITTSSTIPTPRQ
jgi:trehalose/maltose transport system substrate-binding protein